MNTQPPTRRRRRRGVAATLATTACLLTGAAAFASYGSVDPPSPATGHSEVIAQRVIDLEAGSHHWTTADVHLDADTEGTLDQARFVLVRAGVIEVDDAGTRLRLPAGESAYVGEDATVTAGTDGADYTLITLNEGDSEQGGFDPGDGAHDVDLLRDVLAPGEELTITDGELPNLLLVTDGTVIATTDDELELDADESAQLDGDVTITNDGDVTAVIVAAFVGSFIDDEATTGGSSTQPTEATEPPIESSEPGTAVTVSFSPSDPAPGGTIDVTGTGCEPGDSVYVGDIVATTRRRGSRSTSATADATGAFAVTVTISDGPPGGENMVTAICAGVYPSPDGREAIAYGTAADVPTPTPPTDTDSDNDGLSDDVGWGTDPNNPDTDGDSFIDGKEVHDFGTDPNDPNNHP